MARVYGIKKRLPQYGITESQVKDIIGNSELNGIIKRMDELLPSDIVMQILDSCACGSGKEFDRKCEKLDKDIGGKTLIDKINHIITIAGDFEDITLNADNTLTVTWSFIDNGKHKCECPAIVKKGIKVSDLALENYNTDNSSMPLSYCICCAGSCRRYFKLQSGIELKTKKIISSPIDSKGENPCSFVFEIIGV